MNPLIEVVGVYVVPDAADARLVEVVADLPPHDLDLGLFTQEEPSQPRENWQAPWMEQWLDETGERVLTEPFDSPPEGLDKSRVVFFLHYLSPDRPLITPEGEVPLPPPSLMPARLSDVEYEAVD